VGPNDGASNSLPLCLQSPQVHSILASLPKDSQMIEAPFYGALNVPLARLLILLCKCLLLQPRPPFGTRHARVRINKRGYIDFVVQSEQDTCLAQVVPCYSPGRHNVVLLRYTIHLQGLHKK